MKKLERLLIYVIPALLFAGFIMFACLSPRANAVMIISAIFSVLLFAIAILRGIRSILGFFKAPIHLQTDADIGERSKHRMHPAGKIILFALFAQLALILLIYWIFTASNGYSGTIFNKYAEIFLRSNPHGIGIIAHNAAEELAVVPLLPWLVQLLSAIIKSETIAVFLINTSLVCGLCVAIYELVLLDYDKKTAFNSLLFLFISPAVVYFLMPLSGASALMLFAVLALYSMKKSRPITSMLWSLIASLVNIFGILLFVPLVFECIKICINKKTTKALISCIVPIFILVMAIAAIVLLSLHGFIRVRAIELLLENKFGYFFEGIGRLVSTWIASPSAANAMFIAIAAQLLAGLLMCASAKRLSANYTIFMLIWYAFTPVALSESSMSVYLVCICPVLPIMSAVSMRKPSMQLVQGVLMFTSLIIFIASIFVKRLI